MEADAPSEATWPLQRSRKIRACDPAEDGGIPEWPDGPGDSLRVYRMRAADAWVRRGASGRRWWDIDWTAAGGSEAYAAWTMVLNCIDRRGHVWMRIPDDAVSRVPRRLAHFGANRDELQKAMKAEEKNFRKGVSRPYDHENSRAVEDALNAVTRARPRSGQLKPAGNAGATMPYCRKTANLPEAP